MLVTPFLTSRKDVTLMPGDLFQLRGRKVNRHSLRYEMSMTKSFITGKSPVITESLRTKKEPNHTLRRKQSLIFRMATVRCFTCISLSTSFQNASKLSQVSGDYFKFCII